MKILYITDLLSPYRVEWMNLLCAGNEVTAYFFDSEEKTRENKWLQSKQNQFKAEKVEYKKICGIRISPDVFRLIKKQNHDIYIVDGYASLVQVQLIRWLTKNNRRVFVNIDGIDVWKSENILSRLKGKVKQFIYKSGAYFLCGSKIAAKTIEESGAPRDKIFVHPFTSLHTEDIITYEQKKELQGICKKNLNVNGKTVVVAVGRFIKLKKYDVLINAWKDMPENCVLFLIGGGEERGAYEAMIQDNNIRNIVILNFMLSDELKNYYLAADLFVHTSSTETWGLVINEAMANGVPVIATNHCVAGVELIENGKNGYIVQVGNVSELADRIKSIVGSEQMESMSKNAINGIKAYTFENMASTHMKIFERIAYGENNN